MKKLTVLFCLTLTACSTVKYNYIPESRRFTTPEVETIVSVGLGEPLMDQGRVVERDIIEITEEGEISAYDIKKGKLIKIGEDEKSEFFVQDLLAGYVIHAGIISVTPQPHATIQIKKKSGEFCVNRPADVTVCGDIRFNRSKETVVTNDSFRRTLLYSGKVGNKLKISYREFSNDMARAAFSTDVEYDLNESNIIGYAGARLEVIKANNTEITYKVLKHFGER